jgi:hypothetical protein
MFTLLIYSTLSLEGSLTTNAALSEAEFLADVGANE